jgi:hypothetical protein
MDQPRFASILRRLLMALGHRLNSALFRYQVRTGLILAVGEGLEAVAASGDAATQQQTDTPGQEEDASVAHSQDDDGAEQGDQSQKDDGGEKLTDDQKTIRKLQRRVDRLTAGRGAATREAELLREQIAQIQERQPKGQQEDEPTKGVDPRQVDRMVSERAQQLRQRQQFDERANEVVTEGRKLPGFTEAVRTLAEEVPMWRRDGTPTPFTEAVLDAEKPAELLRWLGNNPDEAAPLANLTPTQLGRRLAKLEDRIAQEAKGKKSGAPDPLKPVTPRGDVVKDEGAMTDAEWRAQRFKKRA